MTNRKVFQSVTKENSYNPDERSLISIISTNSVDRSGDIINPLGMKYKGNPKVALGHDWGGKAIGKCAWIKLNDTNTGLEAKTIFADTQDGNELAYLYGNGYMDSFSIGYQKLDYTINQDTGGEIIDSWELLEYSCVLIPANPDCVTKSYDYVKSPELKEIFGKQLQEMELKNTIIELQNEVAKIKAIEDAIRSFNDEFEGKIKEYDEQISKYAELNDKINQVNETLKIYDSKFTNLQSRKQLEVFDNKINEIKNILKF